MFRNSPMAAVQLYTQRGHKLLYTCVLNMLTQRLYHVVVHSEKMASKTKRSCPNHIRHWIETECETEAEKEALARRLDRVRQLMYIKIWSSLYYFTFYIHLYM